MSAFDTQQLLSKAMQDPELKALASQPHVAAALVEIANNPTRADAAVWEDPDVAKVLRKLTRLHKDRVRRTSGRKSSRSKSKSKRKQEDSSQVVLAVVAGAAVAVAALIALRHTALVASVFGQGGV